MCGWVVGWPTPINQRTHIALPLSHSRLVAVIGLQVPPAVRPVCSPNVASSQVHQPRPRVPWLQRVTAEAPPQAKVRGVCMPPARGAVPSLRVGAHGDGAVPVRPGCVGLWAVGRHCVALWMQAPATPPTAMAACGRLRRRNAPIVRGGSRSSRTATVPLPSFALPAGTGLRQGVARTGEPTTTGDNQLRGMGTVHTGPKGRSWDCHIRL